MNSNRAYEIVIIAMTIMLVMMILSMAKLNYDNRELQNRIESLEDELELKNRHLREASQELSEYEQRGGIEHAYNPDVPDSVIGFPIHEEDFLRYTSPFGLRQSPFIGVEVQHSGIDIATIWKAQVTAVADGRIIEHWPPPGNYSGTQFRGHEVYGGMVLIDHGEFETLYGHLDSTRFPTGTEVEAGEVIGRVGSTGRVTGSHLHFEMFVDEERVNPLLYMREIEGR